MTTQKERKWKTYCSCLALAVDQNERRLLDFACNRSQSLDIHLALERMDSSSIVDVAAPRVEIRASVWHLGVIAIAEIDVTTISSVLVDVGVDSSSRTNAGQRGYYSCPLYKLHGDLVKGREYGSSSVSFWHFFSSFFLLRLSIQFLQRQSGATILGYTLYIYTQTNSS